MIVVVTGVPGSGKTLFAIDELRKISERENRPVFVDGVDGLKLPWVPLEGAKWQELPPGAILLIDEAQRVFRPRSSGSHVPDYVAALETHRHNGVDIWMTTQSPSFLDAHVRKLCGRHYHVIRSYGAQRATIWRWEQIKENCATSRKDTPGVGWAYPKDVYNLYKSAEVHTTKFKMPRAAWYLLAAVVAFSLLAWRVYDRRIAHTGPEVAAAPASAAAASSPVERGRMGGPMNAREYVAAYQARVAGLAYTAPVYDKVTQPVRAPYPAACLVSHSHVCQCYSQQGTRIDVPDAMCRGIVAGGFFVAWDEVRHEPVIKPSPAIAQADKLSGGTPGLMTLGATDTRTEVAQAEPVAGAVQGRVRAR